MNSHNKLALINTYNKLKNKKVNRWENRIKKDNRVITSRLINEYMASEIEELRIYITQLKNITTRIVNHESDSLK